jgi:hypothetical protein
LMARKMISSVCCPCGDFVPHNTKSAPSSPGIGPVPSCAPKLWAGFTQLNKPAVRYPASTRNEFQAAVALNVCETALKSAQRSF